jgi:cyclophilin family peptidyl-prolyl cis-trans isomerase
MRKLLLVCLGCTLLAGCGGATNTTSTTAGNGCQQEDMPITGTRNEEAIYDKLSPDKTYDVIFQTSCGTFTVQLDQAQSPNATASIVSLVHYLYYDETVIHRIQPSVLFQGGDPTGTGTGGAGYSTVDKVPSDAKYTRGTVAMAKTGAAQRGTGNGQFFVVTGANAGLNPDYAIVGRVVKGMNVAERIGRLGYPDQTPQQVIEILTANISIANHPPA